MPKHPAKFALLLLLISSKCFSQNWSWATQANTGLTIFNLHNSMSGVAADNQHNVCTTGGFFKQSTFDTIQLSTTLFDFFVTKYDSTGACLWAKQGKYGAANYIRANGITVDNDDNIIVTGDFIGAAEFDTLQVQPSGRSDIFIAKFDKNGNLKWVTTAGSPFTISPAESGIAVKCDGNNNIYVTGFFVSDASFGSTTLSSLGGYDFFIAKLDSNGNFIWAKQSHSPDNEKGTSLFVRPSGEIFVGGVYTGSPVFGNDTLNNINQADEFIFLSKMDTAGNFYWTKQLSCNSVNNMPGLADITCDITGSIFIAGNFYFDCWLDTFHLIPDSNAARNIYFARLSNNGDVMWVRQGSGPNNCWISSIEIEEAKTIVVTGNFADSIKFGTCSLVSPGWNCFVAMFNWSGTCKCIYPAQSANPREMAIDGNKIYLGGSFIDTAYFGTHTITTAPNNNEIFLSMGKICDEISVSNTYPDKEFPFVSVFPNPSDNNLFFESSEKIKNIKLLDLTGRTVLNKNQNDTKLSIETNEIPRGIYLCHISTAQHVVTRKVILQ